MIPAEPVCTFISNGKEITLNKRCDFADFTGNKTFIKIISSNFTDYVEIDDGAVIRIFNCNLECNDAHFVNCTSLNGGGGAIYINNSLADSESNITLEYASFIRCRSNCGGAVFILATSDMCHILVNKCTFSFNEVYRPKNNNQVLFGGSSIFISAVNSQIVNSSFDHGIGKGGSVKIVETNQLMSQSGLELQSEDEGEQNKIRISGCVFDKDEKSDSSIFYVGKNIKNEIDVVDCDFKGKVGEKSRYIDGKLNDKMNPAFRIISCNFEHALNRSVNEALIKESASNRVKVHENVKLTFPSNSRKFVYQHAKLITWLSLVVTLMILSLAKIMSISQKAENDYFMNNFDDSVESEKIKQYDC